jgi:hypothetical protein
MNFAATYVIKTHVNPWYTIDVKRAMIERNIAYRVWKKRRTAADRRRYKEQRRSAIIFFWGPLQKYLTKIWGANPPLSAANVFFISLSTQ